MDHVQDCSVPKYEEHHLNFASSISRGLLEELAQRTFDADCANAVTRVHDQYLNFSCFEDDLFALHQPNSYLALNDPKAHDYEIEECVEQVVNGLFSVLVTWVWMWVMCVVLGGRVMCGD